MPGVRVGLEVPKQLFSRSHFERQILGKPNPNSLNGTTVTSLHLLTLISWDVSCIYLLGGSIIAVWKVLF